MMISPYDTLTMVLAVLVGMATTVMAVATFLVLKARQKVAGLPGPPFDSFFLGNALKVSKDEKAGKSISSTLLEWTTQYGGVIRVVFLFRPVIVVCDPVAIKDVFFKTNLFPKPDYFFKRHFSYMMGERYLGQGLESITDVDYHRRKRTLFNPAFHKRAVTAMVTQFNESADLLMSRFRSMISSSPDSFVDIDVRDYMGRIAMDAISKVALGLDLDFINDDETTFGKAFDSVMNGFRRGNDDYLLRFKPWQWSFVSEVQGATRLLRDFGKKALSKRVELIQKCRKMGDLGAIPDDLLTFMVELHEKSPLTYDSEEEVDDIITFFLAGHETTANTLSWAIRELARNEDWKAKVVEEAESVLGSKANVDAEDISKLVKTEKVLKEVLRLFPPVTMIARVTGDVVHEFGRDKLSLPKGVQVLLNTYSTHRHPANWDNPDAFDPDRWDSVPSDRFTYVPFSGGGRSCIGQLFAQFELKVILARFLRDFWFELLDEDEGPQPFVEVFTLKAKNGVNVRLRLKE